MPDNTQEPSTRDPGDAAPSSATEEIVPSDSTQDRIRQIADEVWKLWRAELRREQERSPDRWRHK